MPKRRHITALCLLLLAAAHSWAGIVIVVNPDNPVEQLSKRQVIDLYMGRNLHFPNGELALRLDQPPSSNERQTFYQQLVKKSVAQVNAYWARLLFTGRASPPMLMDSSLQVLNTVRSNPNAVGYLDESDVDDSVKVVARVH